ncbi:MAG: transglycosylase SLT domain-containing protein [Rubrivivax sp.]|nr:transglycosylase SLT domain-containing protein [Rubrivivax sp.]
MGSALQARASEGPDEPPRAESLPQNTPATVPAAQPPVAPAAATAGAAASAAASTPAPAPGTSPARAPAAAGVPAAVPGTGSLSAPLPAPTPAPAPAPTPASAPLSASPSADTPARAAAAPPQPAPAAGSGPGGTDPGVVGTEAAPRVQDVVEQPALYEDLWARVRKHYAIPALDNELVRKWESYYSSRPDYLQRMFERGGRYLFHIVEEVSRRGMPSELALLPFIESAFNPLAMSSARASGIWQFMPATGRHFDLRQNIFRDDRRSVVDSTRAALDYLQQLHGMFGDWRLALAAYNWGQGNVGRAQASNRRRGQGLEYTDLVMPDETRNYVPKLQAIANLVARPQQFGLQLPPLLNHPYFLTVEVDRDIDVALVIRLAGLSQDEFQALNPQMNKPVILAAGTPQLLLPFESARRFQREVLDHRGPFATWTAWVAPRTLKPSEAAQAVGMSEERLREVNRIPPRMIVKAGSTLLVPRGASVQRDVSEHLADTATMLLAPEASPGRKRTVRAGPRGETVAAMARRLRVNPVQLASWNGVAAGASFKPNQAVVVFSAPVRTAARAQPSKARAGARAPTKARVAAQPKPPVRVAKR